MAPQPSPTTPAQPNEPLARSPRFEDIMSLRIFRLVVEVRSFSAAARQLGLVPATVSKHVSALEKDLGVRLLNRTTRQLNLTEEGERLYRRCVNILEEVALLSDDFSEIRGQATGHIRASIPTVLAVRYVAPRLTTFLQTHPRLSVELELTGSKTDLLAHGIDVAVRFGEQTEPNFVSIKLSDNRHIFVASPAYLAKHGTPTHAGDLPRHNFLWIRGLPPAGTLPGFDTHAIQRLGNLTTDNGEVTRRAAIDGLGIAMLPSFVIDDDIRAGKLVMVLEEYGYTSGIYAVLPQWRHIPNKVRLFVDMLKSALEPSLRNLKLPEQP